MSLKDFLGKYVVSVEPTGVGEADTVDLAQTRLNAKTPVPDVAIDETKVKGLVGAKASFEKIYESVQIQTPAHLGVEKVAEMLRNPKLSSLPREGRAAAVLVALESQGVGIETLVEEAAKKDQALDLFEQAQRRHLQEIADQKDAENRRLQEEVEAFAKQKQDLIQKNKQVVAALEEELRAWVSEKTVREKELFEVLQYFTTDNPVTVGPVMSVSTPVKVTDVLPRKK